MAERSVARLVESSLLAEVDEANFCAALAQLALTARTDPGGSVAQQLRALSSAFPLIIYSLDENGVFVTCYGGGLRALGTADDELVGEPIDAFGPDARKMVQSVLADRTARSLEVEGTTDGTDWWVSTVMVPLPVGDGVIGVAIDRSELMRIRGAHQQSEGLFTAAVEAIDEGVVVQDDHGVLIRANSSAHRILNVTHDQLRSVFSSEPVWETLREDGTLLDPSERPGRRSLQSGLPQKGVVLGLRPPGEDVRWICVNSFPVLMGDRKLVVSTFTDLTEQRQLSEAMRENEQRFRMLSTHAPIGIFITDEDDRITYANPELLRQTGRTQGEVMRAKWTTLIHPDDTDLVKEALRDFMADDVPYRVEHRLVRADGSLCWVRARLARMTNSRGETAGLVGTAADITDLVLADDRLRESEERTRAIIETAAEGIITTDGQGTIIEFNAAAERILGYDSEEIVGVRSFWDLFDADLGAKLSEMFRDYLAGAPAQVVGLPSTEFTMRAKDGTPRPVELAITEVITSEGRLFTGVIHDISERIAFEQQLEHQATHDALTGLPNRALLVAELDAALNRSARRHDGVAVLFVELGRMQQVTDSLGHRAGDQLIIEAARRLEQTVLFQSGAGTVTRFGGDHFVVFAEDLDDVGDAVELSTKIIDELDQPYLVGAEEAIIKTFVGISFTVDGAGTAESLISNADVAMNRARSAVTPGFEVFDTEMRQWVDSRRKLEIAMRHGIERSEFELYYQPIVRVETQEIAGFEALVRWNHPELGLLPPVEFVPLAEDCGLIIPLGELILRDACKQLAAWQRAHPDRGLTVAVNLSARQLAQPDLPATVAGAILEAGADPKGLDFEITESVLLGDVDTTTRTLDGLKKIGVNLAIDDFGTGYSSLTYLCRFPIDIVKVDRSFVSQIGTKSRDASIVSVVIGLAQTLKMDVVAEGVETEQQLTALQQLDCSKAQGYLFSRPCTAADADRLLAD